MNATTKTKIQGNENETKYVDAEGLLRALFPDESRPSVRWVREQQKRRTIPFMKIGHLVRFDVPTVRQSLERRYTVTSKAA